MTFKDFICSIKDWICTNKKLAIGIFFIILIVSIVPPIFIKASIEPTKLQHDTICSDRLKKCLSTFQDPNYPLIQFSSIPSFYDNKFFADSQYPHALSDFFYAASYKTYLPCGYNYDVVDYQAITQTLLKGARAIHLDLFHNQDFAFNPDASVIVANSRNVNIKLYSREKGTTTDTVRKIQTIDKFCPEKYDSKNCLPTNNQDKSQCYDKYLEFIQCLQIIKDFGWVNTTAPLFLYLNLDFEPNSRLEYQIYSQIINLLPNRLVDRYYGFQRTNIAAMPYLRAKGKLIILINRKPENNFLDEITNGILSTLGNVPSYELTPDEALMYSCSKVGQVGNTGTLDLTSRNLVSVIVDPKFNIDGDVFSNDMIPKNDITNYDTTLNFQLGISLSFMYWQKFKDEEDPYDNTKKRNYLKEYLDNFKNGGMVLKPENLRFIPKPPEKIFERNKDLDFNNISVSGHNGFMEFQI